LIKEKLRDESHTDCISGYRVMVTAGSNMAFLNVLPLIMQYAATGALETGSSYCKTWLQQMAKIRTQVTTQLPSLKNVTIIATEGTFYLLLKLDTEKNDLQLVKSFFREFKVAVIPGCAFRLDYGCYLRVSYGMLDKDTANTAVHRLVEGLGKLC
jgi:aspartate/methionine/tyrosine aminotransferase